jgi:hypothetical protein
MNSSILTIEFIPAIIAILSGIIMAFLGKPTIKYFCLLLFCAGMFYGIGYVVEYLTYNDSVGENIVNRYNRAFFWVMAFLLASIVVLLRRLVDKINRSRDQDK